MDLKLTNRDEVWTSDGVHLGRARALYHRLNGADPSLQLYPTYVHVISFELGVNYYIPLDFIAGRDENGRITLSVPMRTVQDRTWLRMPTFVVQRQSQREALPGA